MIRPTAVAAAIALVPACAMAQTSGELRKRIEGRIDAEKGIEGLLVDHAQADVPAASLAKIDRDAVDVIKNVRQASVLVNALDDQAKGFGLAITPARLRHGFPSFSLGEYANSRLVRLAGSLTLSYAQGKEKIATHDYTRRAVAISTSAYWDADDDPVVAVAKAKECREAAFAKIPDEKPLIPEAAAVEAVRLTRLEDRAAKGDADAIASIAAIERKAEEGDARAQADLRAILAARASRLEATGDAAARAAVREQLSAWSTRMDATVEKAALDAFNACADAVLKRQELKWNRTRYSVSLATGSIKRSDGAGGDESLGKSFSASALYGFGGVPALQDRAALSVTVRRGIDEPVLATLGGTSVASKDSTLLAARLAGGSSTFRGLVEASNAKSTDITGQQRAFRRAVGVDVRVVDGLWINLRYGKQRRIDGSGDETGAFMLLHYSPSPKLGF